MRISVFDAIRFNDKYHFVNAFLNGIQTMDDTFISNLKYFATCNNKKHFCELIDMLVDGDNEIVTIHLPSTMYWKK